MEYASMRLLIEATTLRLLLLNFSLESSTVTMLIVSQWRILFNFDLLSLPQRGLSLVCLSKAISLNSSSDATTSLWQISQYNYLIEAYALVRVPQWGCFVEDWLRITTSLRKMPLWGCMKEVVFVIFQKWGCHTEVYHSVSTSLRHMSHWVCLIEIYLLLTT